MKSTEIKESIETLNIHKVKQTLILLLFLLLLLTQDLHFLLIRSLTLLLKQTLIPIKEDRNLKKLYIERSKLYIELSKRKNKRLILNNLSTTIKNTDESHSMSTFSFS